MSKLHQLARQTVQDLTPYQSARRIGSSSSAPVQVWLNANEAPDSGNYALDSANLNRYPEFQPPTLIAGYAAYAGISQQQILATRGADEAIELLIRTFCEPGTDQILINPPTYGMYEISAETCGVNCIKQPLTDTFDPDYPAIIDQLDDVKLVFLCAPNNPTGNLLDQTELRKLLSAAENKALIVCDEAYIEFCPDATQIQLLQEFDNLVILRTLSKAFALASIRCGFALASETVITLLSKVIAPYPIPDPVAQIATQALSEHGLDHMQERVKLLNAIRSAFCDELHHLPQVTKIFPAAGNFLLVQFCDAGKVFRALGDQGVILRDFSNKPRLENCLRITLGSADEMKITLEALKAVFNE